MNGAERPPRECWVTRSIRIEAYRPTLQDEVDAPVARCVGSPQLPRPADPQVIAHGQDDEDQATGYRAGPLQHRSQSNSSAHAGQPTLAFAWPQAP